MNRLKLAVPAMALVVGLGSALAQQNYPPPQQQQNYPQQQQQGYPQQQPGYPQQQQGYPQQGRGDDHDRDRDRGDWDRVPEEYQSDVQQQGFRDGLQGAQQDFQARRQPNATYRREYRHPPVQGRVRTDYRASFQRGYDVGMRHMMERHDDHRDGDHRDGDHHDDDRPGGYQPR